MDELNDAATLEPQVETLETEIKKFADTMPYWARFLADKILAGVLISNEEANIALACLLEELKLTPETEKPEIAINYKANLGDYKADLVFKKLEQVTGVNALIEDQVIEFSPNLTVIYGANGSGKSGYVRLLKRVFYPKSADEILSNIHAPGTQKPIGAKFTFSANTKNFSLAYPGNEDRAEFRQYAVFDTKSVARHLEQKNEFEFRPAGLSFFADFTNAIRLVEVLLEEAKQNKNAGYTIDDLTGLFEGESEIKSFVQSLNAQTKTTDLNKYTPFSDEDKKKKEEVDKKYDEILLASKDKEKQIGRLQSIKKLVEQNKITLEDYNKRFSSGALAKIRNAIDAFLSKAAIAKNEGIGSFTTDKIEGIGTDEWKEFIIAAHKFAQIQKDNEEEYPEDGDNCLLCHQPLSDDAQKMISSYWTFIKSVAEEDAKKAQEALEAAKKIYEKLNFDLFPDDNTLAGWLAENHPVVLSALKEGLAKQKELGARIISDLQRKTPNERVGVEVGTENHGTILQAIDAAIQMYQNDAQSQELEKLQKAKIFLAHKEKYNLHFSKFETYVTNQEWLKKAGKASFPKRKITDAEKNLSAKYFNQKYIDTFNEECRKLNGSFGVEIDHTGSAGRSYKKLMLKGRSPNAVLSEGEQKIIALADFIAEMGMSEQNRGIIFDDPVNSLDNDRKKEIAYRLVYQAKTKQVIIFTHDLVFFYHLKNGGEKYLKDIESSFIHHLIEKENPLAGKIVLNGAPVNEKKFHEPTKAEEYLAKSKKTSGEERTDNARFGLSFLRSSYEALTMFTILGGTIQRFDPQIRMGRLKDVKFDKGLIAEVVEKHGEISDLVEAHLPADEFGIIPTPEILEQHIAEYKRLKDQLKSIK